MDCLEDLPSIRLPRLRAEGVITSDMGTVAVSLAGEEFTLSLALLRFPNGGSWSFFLCPGCGRRATVLRLLNGSLFCHRCCVQRGYRPRCWGLSPTQRAEARAFALREKLNGPSLRLKPHLWGRMERRRRHEASLARREYLIAEAWLRVCRSGS
jgi:hypothetical protein